VAQTFVTSTRASASRKLEHGGSDQTATRVCESARRDATSLFRLSDDTRSRTFSVRFELPQKNSRRTRATAVTTETRCLLLIARANRRLTSTGRTVKGFYSCAAFQFQLTLKPVTTETRHGPVATWESMAYSNTADSCVDRRPPAFCG